MTGLVILSGLLVLVTWYASRRVVDIQDLCRNLAAMTQDRNGFREGYLAACQAEQDLAAQVYGLRHDLDGTVAVLRDVRLAHDQAKATAMTFFRALKASQKDVEQARNSSKRSLDQLSRKVQTLGRVIEERDVLQARVANLSCELLEQDHLYAQALATQEQATIDYAQEQEQALAILTGALPTPIPLDTPTSLVPLAQAVQDYARITRRLASERGQTIGHLSKVLDQVTRQRDHAEARATLLPTPQPVQEQGQ